MPQCSPYTIVLSPEEKRALEYRARKYTSPYFEVIRSKIVLLAADGLENKTIATELEINEKTVGLWRRRFVEDGLAGIESFV